MKKRISAILLLLALGLSAARAEVALPDPQAALSDPAMEKLAGYVFSRNFEAQGFDGKKPVIVPASDPQAALVKQVVERLAAVVACDRPDLHFQVKLVSDDEDNAFCMPGGYVYVFTGLLENIKRHHGGNLDEDELAALLGHEMSHAVLRHKLQQWALSKTAADVLHYNYQFADLMTASSRDQELEADRYGTLYLARAGYKVSAAVEYWDNEAKSGEIPPHRRAAWLTFDHPTNAERASKLRAYLEQLAGVVGLWDESLMATNEQDYDQALICLELLRADFPNLPSVHNNLGWTNFHIYQGSLPESARGDRQVAYSYLPKLGITLRGASLVDRSALQYAASEFDKALQLNPGLGSACEGAALCLLAGGDRAGARNMLARALQIDPHSASAHNNMGVLQEGEGQKDAAAKSYRQSLDLNPQFSPALFNLAMLSQHQGHHEQARELLQRYLAQDHDGYWADKARAQLSQGPAGPQSAPPAPVSAHRDREQPVGRVREVSGIQLGTSSDEVISHLGEPAQRLRLRSGTEEYHYNNLGITVYLRSHRVHHIGIFAPSNATVAEVRLGMDATDVQRRLGPAPQTDSADGLLYWAYASRGVVVALRDARVVAIVVASEV